MKELEFVEKLNIASFNKEAISFVFFSYVSNFESTEEQFEEKCKKYIESIDDNDFSAFGAKINNCLSLCQSQITNSGSKPDETYLFRLRTIEGIIGTINTIYSVVAKERFEKPDNVSSTVAQHESSLKEIKLKIESLNNDVLNATNLIDNKVFSLLINTVAILGIFVAIAFTGFSVTSFFSKLDIANASQSVPVFIRNVFFVLLIILGAYNLLALLIYFIFKLSRPFPENAQATDDKNTTGQALKNMLLVSERVSFSQTVNLKPFWIIDVILLVLTLAAFVTSICVK